MTLADYLRQPDGLIKRFTVFLMLYIISQIAIVWLLKDSGIWLAKLQTATNIANLQHITESLSTLDIQRIHNHFIIDAFHPIWYSLAFVFAMAWLLNLNNFGRQANWLLYVCLIPGLFDLFENVVHASHINNLAQAPLEWVLIGSYAALAKWMLVFLLLSSCGILFIRGLRLAK